MSAPFRVGDRAVVSSKALAYTQRMFAGQTGTVVEIVDPAVIVVSFGGIRVLGYRFEFRRLDLIVRLD